MQDNLKYCKSYTIYDFGSYFLAQVHMIKPDGERKGVHNFYSYRKEFKTFKAAYNGANKWIEKQK